MRFYELAYLVSLNAEKRDEVYQKINQIIEDEGGKIEESRTPQEVALAHPIRKETKAILASVSFNLDESKLEKIKEKITALSSVTNTKEVLTPLLRFLIIKRELPKKPKEGKRKVIQEKETPKKEEINSTVSKKTQKVELKEVNKKIEEILKGQNES